MSFTTTPPREALRRPLILVNGKGGVGKTAISQAIAHHLAQSEKKTLWVTIEDPTRPKAELRQMSDHLWEYNADPFKDFEQFVRMKIKIGPLVNLFVNNRFMKFLAHAAPGISGLVMLGKIIHEVENFDHVVVDMPATGHGLVMFYATQNFAGLFSGGMVSKDAREMLIKLNNPELTANFIVAIPEEMPLIEAMELDKKWRNLFPDNSSALVVNRLLPEMDAEAESTAPETWANPFARSDVDFIKKRLRLEKDNLQLWNQEGFPYGRLHYQPPGPSQEDLIHQIAQEVAQL